MRLEDPAGAELPLALVPAGAEPGARRIRAAFSLDPPPAVLPLAEQILAIGVNVDAVPLERRAPTASWSPWTAPTPP